MFPGKDVYDGTTLWKGDEEYFHKDFIPNTHIEILLTPGHSPEHSSLLVTTEDGAVCIAQDVFWWEDGKQKSDSEKELLELEDPFATDAGALLASRKLVLEKADWIIPGHGKKFRNPKKAISS
jgi:glyoxylase-like metal-dependent hydrolase (beta-lactamase superfamily II)